MKHEQYMQAKPLIEKMENLIINRDEMTNAVKSLPDCPIPIKISYGGNARKATTTINGTDIDTENLMRTIICIIQAEIDYLIEEIEKI